MTVNDCTKEELIYIIDNLTPFSDYRLKILLNRIEHARETKKIEEAQKWADISYKKRGEALDLLKPYKSLADVPLSITEKAAKLMKEADEADKKWAKLSNILPREGRKNEKIF